MILAPPYLSYSQPSEKHHPQKDLVAITKDPKGVEVGAAARALFCAREVYLQDTAIQTWINGTLHVCWGTSFEVWAKIIQARGATIDDRRRSKVLSYVNERFYYKKGLGTEHGLPVTGWSSSVFHPKSHSHSV